MEQPNLLCVLPPETLALLKTNKISLWQACLREEIPLEDLQKAYPGIPATSVPACAPEWAGGQNAEPDLRPREWKWQEIEMMVERLNDGSLLGYEAAILFSQPAQAVYKLLRPIGVRFGRTPGWIPQWAHLTKAKSPTPTPKLEKPERELKTSRWGKKETENLTHYWKLDILTTQDIATLLERPLNQTEKKAASLGLPAKESRGTTPWCGIKWAFTPDEAGDPKALDSQTQHKVAEASAVRFALLYEALNDIGTQTAAYRKIQKELDAIIELHQRIFSKFLSIKSRKYNYQGTSAWLATTDLEQAGKTAIFECLRRWHPNRNIRFSRGAVCIAITREMIAWGESQRLIKLPDKIRAFARQLRQAENNGTLEAEYERLCLEAGENFVKEAAKHQNTYAFLRPTPLFDENEEGIIEAGGCRSHEAHTLEGFQAYTNPCQNTDITEMLLESTGRLTPPERRAVLAYYGIKPDGSHTAPQTLEQIGNRENVTKERIRQRIQKAQSRMRKWMERKNIRSFADAFSE